MVISLHFPPPRVLRRFWVSMCPPGLGETLSQKTQNSNQNNNSNKITFAKHSGQLLNKIAKFYLLNNFTFTSFVVGDRISVFSLGIPRH